jgi:hypothetical protein
MIIFLANLQNNNRQSNVQSYIVENKSFKIDQKNSSFSLGHLTSLNEY